MKFAESIITARKRSLRRLCFYTCLSFCSQGRGWYTSMHYRWYPSMPCSRSRGGGWYPSMPCRFPGPHPRGKLRGVWMGGLQAHTQGWSSGRSGQGGLQAHTWGSIPACTEAEPPHGYCCRWYTSYRNAFLLLYNSDLRHLIAINKLCSHVRHNTRYRL